MVVRLEMASDARPMVKRLRRPTNEYPPPIYKFNTRTRTYTQIRETCSALARVSDRLAALRRRAEVLEAELEADGSVAGDGGVSELCL